MRFQHSNSSDRDDTVLFFQIYPETSTTSPSQTSLPFARAGPRGVPAPRTSSGSSMPLSRTRRRGPTAPPCIFQILPSFSLLSPPLAEAEDVSLGAGHSGRTQELSTTLSHSNSEKKSRREAVPAARNIYKYIVIRLEMLCPLII